MYPDIYIDKVETVTEYLIKGFSDYPSIALLKVIFICLILKLLIMNTYGKELILDLHNCNPEKFTKYYIKKFFIKLCELIDMEPAKVTFWIYDTQEEFDAAPDHLAGTSAVQFISTSNITIHALDRLKVVYLNIFSCKNFDAFKAETFSVRYFEGVVIKYQIILRS